MTEGDGSGWETNGGGADRPRAFLRCVLFRGARLLTFGGEGVGGLAAMAAASASLIRCARSLLRCWRCCCCFRFGSGTRKSEIRLKNLGLLGERRGDLRRGDRR